MVISCAACSSGDAPGDAPSAASSSPVGGEPERRPSPTQAGGTLSVRLREASREVAVDAIAYCVDVACNHVLVSFGPRGSLACPATGSKPLSAIGEGEFQIGVEIVRADASAPQRLLQGHGILGIQWATTEGTQPDTSESGRIQVRAWSPLLVGTFDVGDEVDAREAHGVFAATVCTAEGTPASAFPSVAPPLPAPPSSSAPPPAIIVNPPPATSR